MKILDNNEQNFVGKTIRLKREPGEATIYITEVIECRNFSSYSHCPCCSRLVVKGDIIKNTTHYTYTKWCLRDYSIWE